MSKRKITANIIYPQNMKFKVELMDFMILLPILNRSIHTPYTLHPTPYIRSK